MKYIYLFIMLIIFSALISIHSVLASGFTPGPPSTHAVRIWVQVGDSCRQALPGGMFHVTSSNGIDEIIGPTSGNINIIQSLRGTHRQCPVQHGTCVNNFAGCASIVLPSNATYTITIAKTPPGHNANLRYATCGGGSDCPHSQVATLQIAANGTVSATTLNYYPDGTTVVYPTGTKAFHATQTDPVMFHLFGIGNGSITCDGDHDADDYLTGKPGSHCDSDRDKK